MRTGFLAMLALFGTSAANAQVVIDNFTEASNAQANAGGFNAFEDNGASGYGGLLTNAVPGIATYTETGLSTSNVVGGQRGVTFTSANASSLVNSAGVGINTTSGGSLSFATAAGVTALLDLSYDISGGELVGAQSITLSFAEFDVGSGPTSVEVNGTPLASLAANLLNADVVLDVSSLNLGNTLQISFNGSPSSADFILNGITANLNVPEPASIALWTLMLGAVGAFCVARRRRSVADLVA
jgi:hypothetical protein